MANGCEGMKRRVGGASWVTLAVVSSGLLWLPACRPHQSAPTSPWPEVLLTPRDRILVLAPHPDDEVLGCGGIIQNAVAMRLPIRVVVATYGDNNEWSFLLYRKRPVLMPEAVQRMGLLRHDEALAAAKVLGLSPERLTFLGYPDFGMLQIWKTHWGDRPPFMSMLTRASAVPYANAMRPGAPYKGEEVLADLSTVLRQFKPTKVFVSHPGDSMPDHSALYLLTRVALWDLEPVMTPDVYPYLIHLKRWPKPRGYRPHEPLRPPASLVQPVAWAAHRLSEAEVTRKQAAIRAHRTQYGYSATYLLSFVRPNELFGDFPVVPLRPSLSATPLSPARAEDLGEPAEELTETERAAFVGFEERSVSLEDRRLVMTIRFSRPLAEAVEASVFVFGYRRDTPFGQMPKLHLKLGALLHAVYDQNRRLPQESIQVTRQPKQITLRIPLETLGNPQRILTSARTSLGEIPLDWGSWRSLELVEEP